MNAKKNRIAKFGLALFGMFVCAATGECSVLISESFGAISNGVVVWEDPGFETTVDFVSGPWEVREARPNVGGDPWVNWAFTLPSNGGNPGKYVSITDEDDRTSGFALVGQHITIPEGETVTFVELSIDAKTYCGAISADRAGGIGFALFDPAAWDTMDISLSGWSTKPWDHVSKLWDYRMWDHVGPDRLEWTNGLRSSDSHTQLLSLQTALNEHTGENLILAAYFYDFHYSPEWAQIDNFQATIAVPEPTTLLLLGFGGMALLRRRRQV